MQLVDALDVPLVAGMTYVQVEGTLNALLFIPLGATLTILLGRRLWVLASVIGFIVSVSVEYMQAQIPGRVPDAYDIVWNTLGALVGAVLAAIVAGLIRTVSGPRSVQRAAGLPTRRSSGSTDDPPRLSGHS